jgi:hypothetical protein
MQKLYINYRSYTYVEEDTLGEDGPYTGFRETSTDLTVNHLSRNSKETFFDDIEVSDEVFKADKAYLIIVRYSTGSTFGRDSGCYKFVAVFASKEDAIKVATEIDNHYKNEKSHSFRPTIKNLAYGSTIDCAWRGYFERLESVDIEALAIED